MKECIICHKQYTPAKGMEKKQKNCRSKPCLSKYRVLKHNQLIARREEIERNNPVQVFLCTYQVLQ